MLPRQQLGCYYRVGRPLVQKVLFPFFLELPRLLGCTAAAMLPSKQGELLEIILQNLRNKWPPHPVYTVVSWLWKVALLSI